MIKKLVIAIIASTFALGAMAATSTEGKFHKVAAKHKHHHKSGHKQK